MDVDMKENTLTIRKRATEFSNGPMVDNTTDSGRTENNTAKELIFPVKERPKLDSGKMESACTGSSPPLVTPWKRLETFQQMIDSNMNNEYKISDKSLISAMRIFL